MIARVESDRLLTIPDAAALLGIGERKLRRLVYERRVDQVRIGRLQRLRLSVVRQIQAVGQGLDGLRQLAR